MENGGFEAWLRERGFTDSSITQILNEEFSDSSELAALETQDIELLNLKLAQRKLLERVIEALQQSISQETEATEERRNDVSTNRDNTTEHHQLPDIPTRAPETPGSAAVSLATDYDSGNHLKDTKTYIPAPGQAPSTVVLTQPIEVTQPVYYPDSYMWLSCVACFFCWPIAICACCFSKESETAAENEDYEDALSKSRTALGLGISAIVLGILCTVIIVILKVNNMDIADIT